MNFGSFTVTRHNSVQQVAAEWAALEPYAISHAPCMSASLAWYEAFAGRDEPVIFLGRDESGKALFILPLIKRTYGSFKVLMRPAMKHLAYYSGLFDPDFEKKINAHTAHVFWDRVFEGAEADAVWIDGLCAHYSALGHPLSYLEHTVSTNPCYMMNIDENWDAQYQRLSSSKKRGNDRRARRHLNERGVLQYRVAISLEEKKHYLEQIFRQKADLFEKTGQCDPFCEEEVRVFYERLLDMDHGSGARKYQICGLFLDEKMLAGVFGAFGNNAFLGIIISRTLEEESRYSPGRLILLDLNAQLSRLGVRMHNFGTGDIDYKDTWCDVVIERHHVHKALNAKGQIAIAALKAKTGLKRFVKEKKFDKSPVMGRVRTAFGV